MSDAPRGVKIFSGRPWLWALLLLPVAGLDSCGGGKTPPSPDFSFYVSSSTLTAAVGGATPVDMINIQGMNNLEGSASAWLTGLPPGATSNLDTPTLIQVNACYNCDPNMSVDEAMATQFPLTITTTDTTPTGTFALTLHATSGGLSHETTLTLVVGPQARTYQQGTVLYLESQANGHTARIGVDTAWGGAIVEASMDGTNFVNAYDTGREVQPALYDGAYRYPNTCTGYGWDPVLAGDLYRHGSQVLARQIGSSSLYTKTIPLEWCPDYRGGGPGLSVPTDMVFEQTVSVAPGTATAFLVHYKLTHAGTDTHYNAGQEFPAVWVNSNYSSFTYYGGTSPWTNGAVTTASAATNPSGYAPEESAALVDANNEGLTVFVPGVYPLWAAQWPAQTGGGGPTGFEAFYMTPFTVFTILPSQVIEGDVYLIPGDAGKARATVYALHQSLTNSNIVTPLVSVDAPTANAAIAGSAAPVEGWAFGKTAISAVRIFVDGSFKGSATLGDARPDVAAAYPNLAPVNCGWVYLLDTTNLSNGTHSIVVHVTDASNHEAVLAPVPVTVGN